MLALNLVYRTPAQLIQPLEYNQAAPLAFLQLEKLLIQLGGSHDYVLRLVPLIASAAALLFMYLVGRQFSSYVALFSVALLALAPKAVYYASEVKQYSSDLLVTLVLLYLALVCLGESRRRMHLIALGLAGALAVYFSHPAVFTIAGIAGALGLQGLRKRDRELLLWVGGIVALWTVNWTVLYFASLRATAGNEMLLRYWQHQFVPMPPWRNPRWLTSAFLTLFREMGGVWFTKTAAVLCGIGVAVLAFRRPEHAVLLATPFLATLAASALQKYPFGDRLTLFLVPLIYLLLALGVDAIREVIARRSKAAGWIWVIAISTLLLYYPLVTTARIAIHPDLHDHLKPVLAHLVTSRSSGDKIYVHQASNAAFVFYAPQFGLTQDDYIEGIDSRKDPFKYGADIEQLRGQPRVWFLFSQTCIGCRVDERALYLNILNQMGRQLEVVEAPGAWGYLYDLTRPQ